MCRDCNPLAGFNRERDLVWIADDGETQTLSKTAHQTSALRGAGSFHIRAIDARLRDS